MNPNDQINDLLQRIQALEDALSQLQSVSTIPNNVQDAFAERLGTTLSLQPTGVGTPNGTSSVSSFPVVVPANPSATLRVPYNGQFYELLCK